MTNRARLSQFCGFAAALTALMAVFAAPAAADSCTKLSSLVLPEVISIAATSVAAGSFTPPGLTTPVPVAFCRVQITVTPAINIEVWLPPPANWNHRFQAEGGGGYAGFIVYPALAMAVTGDAVTGQFGHRLDRYGASRDRHSEWPRRRRWGPSRRWVRARPCRRHAQ